MNPWPPKDLEGTRQQFALCRINQPDPAQPERPPRRSSYTNSPDHTPLASSALTVSSVRSLLLQVMHEDNDEKAQTYPTGTCLRCGAAWVGRLGGRPRKWCSQQCRRAAYEERRAAAAGAIAVREVDREVLRVQDRDHDISTCVQRVSDSPAACRRIIRSLDKLVTARTDPRWSSVRQELLKLAKRMQLDDLKHTRWQRW